MNYRSKFALRLSVAAVLGLSAVNAFAMQCERERRNAEAAAFNVERICASPQNRDACIFASGVYAEARAQYQRCIRTPSQGPDSVGDLDYGQSPGSTSDLDHFLYSEEG